MATNPLASWESFVARAGSIAARATSFLEATGCAFEAEHSAGVVAEARRIALRYGVDPEQAEAGAWLHDVSAPIPSAERIALAEALGIEVLPEERTFPMIVHQRISAVMARDLFGVTDLAVLSAIGCHTTLKPGATPLDMTVFCRRQDRLGPARRAAVSAGALDCAGRLARSRQLGLPRPPLAASRRAARAPSLGGRRVRRS